MQPLCTHFTLYTHMHILIKGVLNQGQSPQRTPLLHAHLHLHIHTHMHAHTANITTPTVLVHHSLPSSRSWSPPISTVREENTQKNLYRVKKIKHCCTLYRLSICACTCTHTQQILPLQRSSSITASLAPDPESTNQHCKGRKHTKKLYRIKKSSTAVHYIGSAFAHAHTHTHTHTHAQHHFHCVLKRT